MNFIRDGDVSGLRNGWSKALTLSDLEVFRRFSIFTILHGNASIEVYSVQDRPSFFPCNFSWISVQRNPWIVHPRSRCGIEPSTLRWSGNLHMDFFELEWRFLEVSRALFFKAGPPYLVREMYTLLYHLLTYWGHQRPEIWTPKVECYKLRTMSPTRTVIIQACRE